MERGHTELNINYKPPFIECKLLPDCILTKYRHN